MLFKPTLAVLTAFFLLQDGVIAATGDASIRWNEVPSAVAGGTVRMVLPSGARIEGKVVAVAPDALRIHIGKTSDKKIQPKGAVSIPRNAVSTLQVVRYGKKWRVMGTATSIAIVAIAGAGAGYAAASSGTSTDNVQVLATAASAAAAGICVGGYYLGKRADRHITTIRIVPEP